LEFCGVSNQRETSFSSAGELARESDRELAVAVDSAGLAGLGAGDAFGDGVFCLSTSLTVGGACVSGA